MQCGPEETSYIELATLPSTPFWARRHTRASLRAWQICPGTIDTAELLVSELATNAIMAAAAAEPGNPRLDGSQRIAITFRLQPARLVIEVSDDNPNPPLRGHAAPDAESGRGLMLVEALAKEWGYFLPPAGGKTVFAVLSVPPELAPQPPP